MRRFFPVILIAILASAMFVLNQGMKKNAVPDHDDDDDQQQQQQATDKPAPKPVTGPNVSDPIPSEITVGNPASAKYRVTLGWTYDEGDAGRQEQAQQTIEAVRSWVTAHPDASLEVVNLDVPSQDLSPNAASVQSEGLAVNGNSTFNIDGKSVQLSSNLGEGTLTAPGVVLALHSVAK